MSLSSPSFQSGRRRIRPGVAGVEKHGGAEIRATFQSEYFVVVAFLDQQRGLAPALVETNG